MKTMEFVPLELLSIIPGVQNIFSLREDPLLHFWVWGSSRPQLPAILWESLMQVNSFELLKIPN